MTAVGLGALVLFIVLLWPSRRARLPVLSFRTGPGENEPAKGPSALATLWRQDPLELWRRRRRYHAREHVELAVLSLLDGIAAALRAGLPPARAIELAGLTLPDEPPVVVRELVRHAVTVSAGGLPVAQVWRELAGRSESAVVHGVAAAWGLSEATGSPLAEAVDRAAAQLRAALAGRRKLSAAVAGPRATVTVLTALPLTGPLFGLACGVPPVELYGNAVGGACLAAGLVLIALGRLWCGRLVRGAEHPT